VRLSMASAFATSPPLVVPKMAPLVKRGKAGAARSASPRKIPRPAPEVSANGPWLRLAASAMRELESQVLSCAGMRWSVPEVGTNLGTNSIRREFRSGQPAEKNGGQGRD
jgi:hypothetical protein